MRKLLAALAATVALGAGLAAGASAVFDDASVFCSEFVPNMEASSYYAKWGTANRGEKTKWLTFRTGVCNAGSPTPPLMATGFGKALIAAGKMAIPDEPLPPPPPPPPPTPEPTPASSFLSPNGLDANPCTKAAPCRSLNRGMATVAQGGTVEMAGGSYAGQSMAGYRSSTITFRPAEGEKVTFVGQLHIGDLRDVFMQDFNFVTGDPYRDLFLDACNSDLTFSGFTGKKFFILEGNTNITIQGGSWGGYSAPTDVNDSAIGTAGYNGPTRMCNGAIAPPASNITIDGVTFHDVFWGIPPSQWGQAHPDCFEINGYAENITVKNSFFLRCGDSFMGLYSEQGQMLNVNIENNVMQDGATYGYYMIQLIGGPSTAKPKPCGGITFKGNTWQPNNPNAGYPFNNIRPECDTTNSGEGATNLEDNTFQGPIHGCYTQSPFNTSWSNNTFQQGGGC